MAECHRKKVRGAVGLERETQEFYSQMADQVMSYRCCGVFSFYEKRPKRRK